MSTWQGTKNDFQPTDPFTNIQVNRREGNQQYLFDRLTGLMTDFEDNINQGVKTTDSPMFAGLTVGTTINAPAINTGHGNNEVYAMDQNVRTTDIPTFAAVNTGQGNNELYAMNQDLRTTDSPTFNALDSLDRMRADGVNYSGSTISGSQSVAGNSSYVLPKGKYDILLVGGMRLQVFIDGGWNTSDNPPSNPLVRSVVSDGTNYRLLNETGGTVTVHWRIFV